MITFPDEIIGRAFGPVSGRHHDAYLAARSGLYALLAAGALMGFRLFGDKAYIGFGALIIHPFIAAIPGSLQFFFNTYTSAYRIEVEHDIGNLYMEWAILQRKQNLSTEKTAAWFQAAVLMHNIRICLYHNSQTAIRFGIPPPSLEEYLPVHH